MHKICVHLRESALRQAQFMFKIQYSKFHVRRSMFPDLYRDSTFDLSKLLFLALLTIVLLGGCSKKQPSINLGEIYNRSAMSHPIDRNPVILIPGITGSRLVDSESGTVVWGTFGSKGLNPNTPLGMELFGVPMKQGVPLNRLTDSVVADSVLDNVEIGLAGLSFNLKAYYNIVSILGAGMYIDYDIATQGDNVDYGGEHYTCFQFAYDWRLSLDENARRLDNFIKEQSVFVQQQIEQNYGIKNYDVKFDLVAHSMGGLLSRYFLRYGSAPVEAVDPTAPVPWTGTQHVDRLIMVGTPNAGSVEAVINFVDGMIVAPIFPKFSPTLVGSIPAVYQLLPRNRHKRVVDADQPEVTIDLYDPEVWIQNQWGLAQTDNDALLKIMLPNTRSPEERKAVALDHLTKSLKKAEAIAEALDRPASPPETTSIHLFAGDAIDTPATLAIDSKGNYSVYKTEHGDGTVVRSSALLDERIAQEWQPRLQTPIEFDDVNFIFESHLGLTKDKSFSDNLLFLLLEQN